MDITQLRIALGSREAPLVAWVLIVGGLFAFRLAASRIKLQLERNAANEGQGGASQRGARRTASSALQIILMMFGLLPAPKGRQLPVSVHLAWSALLGYIAFFAGLALLLLRVVNFYAP
jgi:hypothetical protein